MAGATIEKDESIKQSLTAGAAWLVDYNDGRSDGDVLVTRRIHTFLSYFTGLKTVSY